MNDDLLQLFRAPAAGEYTAYAGIGSRETPPEVCQMLTRVGSALASRGFTLRSGGAPGADQAFEAGAVAAAGATEIYIPRAGWRGSHSDLNPDRIEPEIWREAERIAARFHPDWSLVRSPHARALLTRDTFQVLGPDLRSPSRFVIAWTQDGLASGGTGQAMRIAEAEGIPVLNVQNEGQLADVLNALDLEL